MSTARRGRWAFRLGALADACVATNSEPHSILRLYDGHGSVPPEPYAAALGLTQRKAASHSTSPLRACPRLRRDAYSATEQRQQAVFGIEQLPHEHVSRCERGAARRVRRRRRLPQARCQEHVRDDKDVAAPGGRRIKTNRHRAAMAQGSSVIISGAWQNAWKAALRTRCMRQAAARRKCSAPCAPGWHKAARQSTAREAQLRAAAKEHDGLHGVSRRPGCWQETHPEAHGKRLNRRAFIALDIRDVLEERNDHREDGHESTCKQQRKRERRLTVQGPRACASAFAAHA